ncbi:MAG TPA: hypothetical protein VHQ24_09750, partial [Lachnospiraceae bacterium]|nr:hypothetical protein [Lachnospiraceae bacterium]
MNADDYRFGKRTSACDGNHGYKKSDLEDLTTVQLRGICMKEKIINGVMNALNRYELIDTIMRFRGIPEDLFIREVEEGGYDRIKDALQSSLGSRLEDSSQIVNPAKLTIYRGLEMTPYEKYLIRIQSSGNVPIVGKKQDLLNTIRNTNALLVNESGDLCGIFNLVTFDNETDLYLTKDATQEVKIDGSRGYTLLFFQKRDSDYLFHRYYSKDEYPCILNYYQVSITKVEIRDPEETESVLSLDFGTSNTTAGAFLDYSYIMQPDEYDIANDTLKLGAINMVQFLDDTEMQKKFLPIIPTVASVVRCKEDNVRYHFGYDAVKDATVKFYEETFSIFYEMKRWVETYQESIEIVDKEGNIAWVTKGSIIREYLLYVINRANARLKCKFKKLHLTYPVKLKEKFESMFTELLPEYELLNHGMLDEGSAVLYNTIHTMIEKKTYYEGERLAALIIDCGGGTTDLSSCIFSVRNLGSSYQVTIDTAYENGETNFGGNNITYRIMQYLKIVFAAYYTGQRRLQVSNFIEEVEQDVFRMVDRKGRNDVYHLLEEEYDRVDDVIPTRFKQYENRSREEYYKVKNNFYFLFQMADRLKREFFKETGVLQCRFALGTEAGSELQNVIKVDNWNLIVREDGKERLHHDVPPILFNINEIELLMKADIYWIINKFLNKLFVNGELEQYSVIKLSGQSCRIGVFREALKEFIPGKCIEFKPYGKDEKSIMDLKLACVRGAIQYVHALSTGMIKADVMSSSENIPYSISA